MRTLLVLLSLACLALGWFSIRMRSATRQREAIQAIENLGGQVYLDYILGRASPARDVSTGNASVDDIFGGSSGDDSADENPFSVDSGSPAKISWLNRARNFIGERFLFRVDSIHLWGRDNLTDDELSPLENIDGARTLDLHSSTVRDAGFYHARNFRGLEVLDLGDTEVTGSILECVAEFTDLRTLILNGTKIDNDSLRHIRNLIHLEELELEETAITDEGLANLGGLTNLKHLSLSGTQIRGYGFKYLEKLNQLESIDLARTQFSDDSILLLPSKKTLSSIDISGTRITDRGLRHFAVFSSLSSIDLDAHVITDASIPYLNPARPLELSIHDFLDLDAATLDKLEKRGVEASDARF